jgi:hypothetical protein
MSSKSNKATTQTPEQIAALAKMRQQKEIDEALAKTEQPKVEFASSAPFTEDEIEMSQFWADMKAKLPSGKRAICALIVSVSASFATTYSIQWICAYAVAGVLALSGSALLAMIISALSWILSILVAVKIGGKVFAAVVTGDYGIKVPASLGKLNPMKWFKSEPIIVAA